MSKALATAPTTPCSTPPAPHFWPLALPRFRASAQPDAGKTHGGLISAFSLHLVKTERVPVEYGRTFNRMEELRLIADYKGDPIEQEQAEWAVDQAQADSGRRSL